MPTYVVTHFYQVAQQREFGPSSFTIQDAHVLVDHHLEPLELVYDVEEDESLPDDALRPNTTIDGDDLIAGELSMKSLHEFRYRISLVFMLQAWMSLWEQGVLALCFLCQFPATLLLEGR